MSDFELPSKLTKKSAQAGQTGPIVNKALLKAATPSFTPETSYDEKPGPVEDPELKNQTSIDPASVQRPPLDLSKIKFEDDELMSLFDTLIFTGGYSEGFKLAGRYPITLKVRTAKEINEIQKILDSSNLNLISSVEALRSVTTLRYALISYGDKDLSGMKPEERDKFIAALPGPVIGMLLNYLAVFDYKVAEATRVGNENF